MPRKNAALPDDRAFAVIREVAIEHSSSPDARSCRCGHFQNVHLGRWGACTGRHRGPCDCRTFHGLYASRQRMLERFGVALLARLRNGKKNT